ncbi:unnamed protein product [Didymodactylos carnosus]|uniref:Cytochrome P450 n=1 Tax=Didymodactylos carnosus TaxID=1234261 RepID=A0A8S2F725_9BILA|nr:unnamed protein product [Didymodactylos carnosus]CAF4160689.1 unnamed protein product [Didymodactylos carnosus]
MAILVGSLVMAAIILVLAYFLRSNDGEDSSIPYATYGSYPVIGHLLSFLRCRTKLLLECGQQYGQCFRIKVLKQRFTMILSYADWMTIIRNQSLKFDGIDFGIKIFGISPALLKFDADGHRLYVQHLKNRDGLRPMVVEFVRRTRKLMKNEKVALEKNGTVLNWISSGLLEFSHHMLYQPSTLALIGEIDPSSLENDFRVFDKSFHYFIIPFPRWVYSWFLPRELKARSRLNASWLKNRDPPHASEFHRDRLAHLSNNSHWLSNEDYGGLLTGFFWASLGNTIPGVFWSLFYILRDAKALETIKEEINTHLPDVPLNADDNDSLAEDWTPEQLDLCAYLESAINETLRLVGAPFMTRKCFRETQIVLQDGRTLNIKPDETVAWFGGASHFDPNMFPEPTTFVFDRFLNKKAETVPGFMPFGGGKSICPGRFFAKYEIKTCVAMLLRYMEYKLEVIETIPTQVLPRIGVGIAPPSRDIPIMYRYKI